MIIKIPKFINQIKILICHKLSKRPLNYSHVPDLGKKFYNRYMNSPSNNYNPHTDRVTIKIL